VKRRNLRRLFEFPTRTRSELRAAVEEEFQFHLDMRTAELVESGLSPEEAKTQAVQEFGSREAGARACAAHDDRRNRRLRLARAVDGFRQDLTFALRMNRRSPGIAASAIVTLAIAVGANTAIFSVANALLLTPPMMAEPRALVRVHSGESRMSWPNYEDIRDRNDVFEAVAAYRHQVASLAGDPPQRLTGQVTSLNYPALLGVAPLAGRIYDSRSPSLDVIVIADHVWRGRFGGDPEIVGRRIVVDGRPVTIIGVMPPRFKGVMPPAVRSDFWMPADVRAPLYQRRDVPQVEVVARLAPGVSASRAAAAMRVLGARMAAEHPGLSTFAAMEVFPISGLGAYRGMAGLVLPLFAFLALLAIVGGLVLLVACSNIAGLLIGRASARQREMAIRAALGAGRARLIRQMIAESLLLAAAGGAAGLLVARWAAGSVGLLATGLPVTLVIAPELDRRVLGYAILLSTASCVLFGLAPAVKAARWDVASALKTGGTKTAGRHAVRRALVVGQVAVCSLLLVWSGLFLRSLGEAAAVDPGFEPRGVLLANLTLDGTPWQDGAAGEPIFLELQRRVAESPQVEDAGAAQAVPLSLTSNHAFYISSDASEPLRIRVMANMTTPGWFDTVRIARVAGRDFTLEDRAGAPPVAIVNETLARRLWNGSAVGERFRAAFSQNRSEVTEVIGVVRDSKYWTIGEAVEPTVYLPFRQHYFHDMTLHVRTADPAATTALIEQTARELAPGVTVDVKSMTDAVAAALIPAQVGAAITSALGVVSVLIAGIGLYGLIAFVVVQRTREIGVRRTVGATTGQIVRMIVGGGAKLAAAGLLAGLAAGTVGAMGFRGFIVGVSPSDPLILAGVAVVVMLVATAASVLPAVRAVRVDPLVALRDD
jgi:predicted permease